MFAPHWLKVQDSDGALVVGGGKGVRLPLRPPPSAAA